MKLSSFTLVSLLIGVAACQVAVPVVQTRFGAVHGVFIDNDDGQFFQYMGIPYGRPPLDNKFGPPVDPEPYNGTLEAYEDSTQCAQREEFYSTLVGKSDCLDLNIIVPANRTSNEPMSVYFFIYGGGFQFGFAGRQVWGPEKLAAHDVIVVNINYRVNIFGFFCLGSNLVSGNTGFKDLLKGLRWVQENIGAFGGRADDITIGGSSAGAYAVEYLIVSPKANGLFNRAILQSGSILNMYDNQRTTSHNQVLNIASYFGYRGGSIDGALRYLQHIDDLDLVEVSEIFYETMYHYCIEPDIDELEPILTDIPSKLLNEGDFQPVDVLLGFNSREAPFDIIRAPVLNESYMYLFYVGIQAFDMDDEERDTLADTLRYFYLGSQNISEDIKEEFIDFQSDVRFNYAIRRSADTYRRTGKSVYLYEFSYDGGRNFNKLKGNINYTGAIHADEIGYLFNQFLWDDIISESDSLIIQRMTQMWTNFVKYGDPTPNITDVLTVKWLPYEERADNYIIIDTVLEALVDPIPKRKALWELIYLNYADYSSI